MKEKVEDDDGDTLDFIMENGKKMSKKRIQTMHQSGAFTPAQVLELEKQGYLSLEGGGEQD